MAAITDKTQVVGVKGDDLNLSSVQAILENSPALVYAPLILSLAKKWRVRVSFALTQFLQESALGSAGIAVKAFNPAGMRSSVSGLGEVKGGFVYFNNWKDGFTEYFQHLAAPGSTYVKEGRTTIRQVIERWAPAEDGNQTEKYIKNVVKFMNGWLNGGGEVTQQQFNIVWRGTNGNNFWPGREGENVAAICDHIMQGTMESSDGWFKNAKSEVSAHFGVAKNGRIWQWVDVNNRAWANGIPENPDTSVPFIADAISRKKNPNDFTVSIEHEGDTGDVFPEAQYQATLWLHRYIMSLFPAIKADRKHIVGHYQISAKSRPNCPGSSFPWQRLMDDLVKNTTSSVGGGIVPQQNLPYGVTVDPAGALIFPGNIPLNFGFKTAFLTLFGNVEQGELAAAIMRGVRIFGLPVSPEIANDTGSTQDFELCEFRFNKNEAEGWQVRLYRDKAA